VLVYYCILSFPCLCTFINCPIDVLKLTINAYVKLAYCYVILKVSVRKVNVDLINMSVLNIFECINMCFRLKGCRIALNE